MRIVVLLLCLVAVFAAFAVSAKYLIHGKVTAVSLAVAVTDQSGSAGSLLDQKGHCRETRTRLRWRCSVLDGGGSGGVDYLVQIREGSSCFSATRVTKDLEGGTKKQFDGCVFLWQWSFISLL